MEQKEKIIQKIKALLQKTTDRGATKAEMESALAKANQLMTEHYISQFDLKQTNESSTLDFLIIEKSKSKYDFVSFLGSLGHLFNCIVMTTVNESTLTIFGEPDERELVAYFYDMIVNVGLKEKELFQNTTEFQQEKQHFSTKQIFQSFINGYSRSVDYKIHLLIKERDNTISQETGLMKINQIERVKIKLEEKIGKVAVKTNKRKEPTANKAFAKGVEKGMKINLTKGIPQSQQTSQTTMSF
jgi:hypothetical protein